MSGVLGIVAAQQDVDLGALSAEMAHVLVHREWHISEVYVDREQCVALGRVGIGIFNRNSQPVWNAAHTVALAMAGEFYRVEAEGVSPAISDAEIALQLYEAMGESFVTALEGAFVIAIWDARQQILLIANDRFGLYPLFYAHENKRIVFAPEMKGILCDPHFRRTLDLTALAQYMRFQHLLGERTFFEGLKLLPSASLLLYRPATDLCQVKAYWTLDQIPYRPQIQFHEAVEEAGCLLRRAVERLSGDAYRPGVFLSGGLDSRTILGMAARRPIISLTYGSPDCRDVYYARKIAQVVGSDHYWVDMSRGTWLSDSVDLHLELTEGFHSWIHAHGISALPLARQLMDINLTGWDGGTVMGHNDSIEPLQVNAVDDRALLTRLYYLFTHTYTWPGLEEAEELQVYTEVFRQELFGRAFESFRTELAKYLSYRPDVRGEYFYISNHCKRLTFYMVLIYRSYIETRFPFFDYNLFDFLYSLPVAIRGHRRLYYAMIQKEIPALSYIPYDHDEFLPTTHAWIRNSHALVVKLKRRLNQHVAPFFHERATLYADYERYLRTDLREWGESILFDRRTLDRGIFDPAFLQSLWARHQSGQELHTIGKIAPIMTYEMMLRRFYD